MKRFFTTLLVVFFFATATNAQNGSDQNVDFQIVAQDDISTPIYRGPLDIPVQGYYSSFLNTLYLSFTYDLGMVNVNIENEMTGESMSEVIPTDSGVQAIPLCSEGEIYTIMLSIPDGRQFIAILNT